MFTLTQRNVYGGVVKEDMSGKRSSEKEPVETQDALLRCTSDKILKVVDSCQMIQKVGVA